MHISDGVIVAVLVNLALIMVVLFILRPVYEYYWYLKLQKALLRSLEGRLEDYSRGLSKKVMDQLDILVGRKVREGLQEWKAHNDRTGIDQGQ